MTEVIVAGPFQELELPHQYRLQPAATRHLRLRQSLSPSAALLFRQIHERAVANLEAAELPEQLRAHGRRETIARARDVDQPVIFVVAEDQRIERLRADRVAADHELLSL